MDRDLKHYKLYMKKLTIFAKGLGIKIKYRDLDSEGGVYVPLRRSILLEKDLSTSVEIAILLHELGHSVDDTIHIGGKVKALNKAYTALYDGKVTKKQRKLVLDCEMRAWEYGRGIAKQLKIRLGKWYEDTREYCLEGYR